MSHEMLNLEQAAEHVHLEENELRHVAQRGEIAAIDRGDGDWLFDHVALDEWAQRHLLSANKKDLITQHRTMMDQDRRAHRADWGVADYLKVGFIDLALQAKAKAGLLRDMTDLADRTGLVYDPEALYHELQDREAVASTAIGMGMALLHPRFHDPYLFADSFIAYGRTTRPLFFGAADGAGTRHFFLIGSTDHEQHLHLLARLAMLAHGSELMAKLENAETPEEVLQAVRASEESYRS